MCDSPLGSIRLQNASRVVSNIEVRGPFVTFGSTLGPVTQQHLLGLANGLSSSSRVGSGRLLGCTNGEAHGGGCAGYMGTIWPPWPRQPVSSQTLPPFSCPRPTPPVAHFMRMNSPSGGTKLIVRSASNFPNRTHWWKVISSRSISEFLTVKRVVAIVVSAVEVGLQCHAAVSFVMVGRKVGNKESYDRFPFHGLLGRWLMNWDGKHTICDPDMA